MAYSEYINFIRTVHCALAGLFRSKKEKKLGHRHQPTAFKVHLKTFSRAFFFLVPTLVQKMTEAEHNRPIPKFFDNRPSSLAAEVFGETIGLVIY